MHRTIATVLAPDAASAAEHVAAVGTGADWIEVRLDGFWHDVPDPDQATDALLLLLDAAKAPLVATLRPARQGGQYAGAEDVRVSLLVAAAQVGFAAVDLELDVAMPRIVAEIQKAGAQVIASLHTPAEPPCRSDGQRYFTQLRDAANIQKLAFPTGSFLDELRALEMAHEQSDLGAHPVVAPMGASPAFRALLPLAGNEATYAGATGASAPSQPSLEDVAAVWRHWGLTSSDFDAPVAGRHWLAVLGQPVDKSLSPRMHNAALRAAHRTERYGALNVPDSPGAFRLVCHAAARIGLVGASVTYPHKTTAARLADCDEVAKAVGAANQIRFVQDKLQATNTDATALRRILAKGAKPGMTAIVLGAGGAARAAIWACKKNGINVRVAARDEARATAAVALADGFVAWRELPKAQADIWIQATTLGLRDADEFVATPRGAKLAIELNYKSGTTRFERDAKAAGAVVIDGREVVLAQAVDAWRFWFGAEPDEAAMRRAVAG